MKAWNKRNQHLIRDKYLHLVNNYISHQFLSYYYIFMYFNQPLIPVENKRNNFIILYNSTRHISNMLMD